MKIKRIIVAQTQRFLTKKTLNGIYGQYDAYLVTGSTIPIKEELKRLGFSWDGKEVAWRLSVKKMTPQIRQSLVNLGVTEQGIEGQNVQSQEMGVKAPVAPSMSNPLPPPEATKPKEQQWVTEDEDLTRWYGFPINNGIMKFDTEREIEGKKYKILVSVDRSVTYGKTSDTYRKTKSREDKGLPKYVINIEVPELDIKQTFIRRSKVLWGQYSEEAFLEEIKSDYLNAIEKDDTSKLKRFNLFGSMKLSHDLDKRTPEYVEFLKRLTDYKTRYEYPAKYNFRIDSGEYAGNYELVPLIYGEDPLKMSLSTHVDRPNAPSAKTVGGYDKISLVGTYTVQDFHDRAREYIAQNKAEIEKDYIEYLSSFPYLDSQLGQEKELARKIAGYIKDVGNSGAEEILRVLQERGLIRPHKRQRQSIGLTMGDEIRWVIDDDKIRNGIYGRGYGLHSPGYFYDVVAYYVLQGIRRFSAHFTTYDSYYTVLKILNDLGSPVRKEEIVEAVTKIGDYIVNKIRGATEEKVKTDTGSRPTGSMASNPQLLGFYNFAKMHEIPDEELAEDNVKNIYRMLARHLHPDMQQDPIKKKEYEEKFKQLQMVWDSVPEIYKKADSWYGLYKSSNLGKA